MPNAIKGSLDIIAKAFDEAGISHLLCYEISDRDGAAKKEQALEETDSYLQHRQGLVGLHASFTVGDSTFRKAVNLADNHNAGIHIHVAEDKYDQEHCNQQFQTSVIERIKSLGGLANSKTILEHRLHLQDTERRSIGASGAWVAQNTESNLNNRVVIFIGWVLRRKYHAGEVDGMVQLGCPAAKASYFIGLNNDKIDLPGIYLRFRNAQRYLIQNSFQGKGENNLVVLDYKPQTEFNAHNFLSHFIYGIESKHIQHVISSGRLIVNDRKSTSVDEDAICEASTELSKKLWQKMSQL